MSLGLEYLGIVIADMSKILQAFLHAQSSLIHDSLEELLRFADI